jgi:uncharacterized membrane protein YfcA
LLDVYHIITISGEVIVPQLVKISKVPAPVAAATSVLVVLINAVAAAGTQISELSSSGGGLQNAIPFHLVLYTIPGVIVGGQLAPRLQVYLHYQTKIILMTYIRFRLCCIVRHYSSLCTSNYDVRLSSTYTVLYYLLQSVS